MARKNSSRTINLCINTLNIKLARVLFAVLIYFIINCEMSSTILYIILLKKKHTKLIIVLYLKNI